MILLFIDAVLSLHYTTSTRVVSCVSLTATLAILGVFCVALCAAK